MSRSIPLSGLAIALGLMAHGQGRAQDHSQHAMPAPTAQEEDHSQHQATSEAAEKKKTASQDEHAGHAGHAAVPQQRSEAGAATPEVDHAAMGHADPKTPPADKAAADHGAMDHGSMDHSKMDHGAMDHSAMGHAQAASGQPLTPIPDLTDSDRAAAFPELQRHMEHAQEVNSYVLFNRLEGWDADHGSGQAWEGQAWIGTDLDRLWLRSEGERTDGHTESADLEVLYGRSVSTWWDVVAGIKHDFQPGPSQTWAAIGVQGLAPYKFEVQATAYVGESGQTAANLEAEYELLLTNRLILQPLVEVNLYGKDDARRGIGSGLSTAEAGLRLRYEFSRRFAPYVGLVHERAFGNTADLREAEGEDKEDTRVVAGVRIWF